VSSGLPCDGFPLRRFGFDSAGGKGKNSLR